MPFIEFFISTLLFYAILCSAIPLWLIIGMSNPSSMMGIIRLLSSLYYTILVIYHLLIR